MVISDKNQFIFIRIPKNASTSLATFFVQNYCGPQDKWSAIGDSGIPNSNIPDSVISKYRDQYRFIHLTLNEIIQEGLITSEQAKEKRIIGVIRNPLERQLSLYFFKNRHNKNRCNPIEFRKIMQKGFYEEDGSNHILQTDYLKTDNENVGTYWKYPNLNDHIAEFIEEYGIPNHPIQSYKSQFKPKDENLISEYYDPATRKAVEKYFAKDFEEYEN